MQAPAAEVDYWSSVNCLNCLIYCSSVQKRLLSFLCYGRNYCLDWYHFPWPANCGDCLRVHFIDLEKWHNSYKNEMVTYHLFFCFSWKMVIIWLHCQQFSVFHLSLSQCPLVSPHGLFLVFCAPPPLFFFFFTELYLVHLTFFKFVLLLCCFTFLVFFSCWSLVYIYITFWILAFIIYYFASCV